MAGIILAGGYAARMGRVRKSHQLLAGKTLLDWVVEKLDSLFDQLILVTDCPHCYLSFPGLVVSDIHPGQGPLGGIEAGLLVASDQVNFVCGCDMPFLSRELICYMGSYASSYDVVIPRIGHFIEPLHAFYSRRTLGTIRTHLEEGNHKLGSLLVAPHSAYYINENITRKFDPELLSFFNINTWADLELAHTLLEAKRGAK
jgi:molybdopterin-guanine dinucleotide biosynthesis protein A